jgi:FkbM family methyltransferase
MLQTVLKLQETPLILVDIGARGGTKAPWSQLKKYLVMIGFEPESVEFQNLQKKSTEDSNGVFCRYYPFALWSASEQQKLYVAKGRGKSSLFKPNKQFLERFTHPDRYNIIQEIVLDTKTLDDVLAKDFPDGVDFIKLDCQGADLAILKGATNLLDRSVFGVEIEVLFGELYKDNPRFAEIDQHMRSLGFSLFDLKPVHWKRISGLNFGFSKGQIMFADALYFRDQNIASKFNSRQALLKAMQIVSLYGYFDFAFELALQNKDLLSESDFQTISKAIDKTSRHWIFRIPFRLRILGILMRLVRFLSTHRDPTSNINGTLGNR